MCIRVKEVSKYVHINGRLLGRRSKGCKDAVLTFQQWCKVTWDKNLSATCKSLQGMGLISRH